MKKIILTIAAILFATSFNINFPVAKAATTNLISNPSAETSVSGNPTGWAQGYPWGDIDATYTYKTGPGAQGTHYLSTSITRYVSSDAKWYFTPVAVKPNTQYAFSDYYRSNINSDVMIQYTDNSGNNTYSWLETVAPSDSFKQTYYLFTTPANVKSMTVFHNIQGVGTLDTDNFLLSEAPTDGLIPNTDLELKNPADLTMPLGWNKGNWGNNSAQLQYQYKFGHNGSKGNVGVIMKNYVDGDAKWYYNPQPVVAGQSYLFSAYYNSSIDAHVSAMVTKSDGTTVYPELKTAEATGPLNWTQYSDIIVMPAGAVTASIFLMLNANGTLWTDDYSMSVFTPAAFNQGMVTLTFDDGYAQNYQTALPLMNAMGIKSTQYWISSTIENGTPADIENYRQFVTSGHEIGSHTVTHQDLTTLDSATLQYELTHSKEYLSTTFNTPINAFAAPYGVTNKNVLSAIKQNYASERTVNMSYNYNAKNTFDIYNVRAQSPVNTTTDAEVQSWIDYAKTNKVWVVICYHAIDTDAGTYSNTPTQFQDHLNIIKNSGLPVLTMSQAIAALQSQITK